jgi:hypothetical protein
MKPWEAKYTGDQWRAIYDARFAKDLTYARIADLAADGTLTGEPFEIGAMYIGEKCRAEKKRRAGKHKRPIADLATKDSNEFMRASLLNLWDTERFAHARVSQASRGLSARHHKWSHPWSHRALIRAVEPCAVVGGRHSRPGRLAGRGAPGVALLGGRPRPPTP